jgi:hypothetical protein
MISDHLRLDIRRTDAKMSPEMNTKSQAVQECASTQYAIVTRHLARNVGERVRWIGDATSTAFGAARTIFGTISL